MKERRNIEDNRSSPLANKKGENDQLISFLPDSLENQEKI